MTIFDPNRPRVIDTGGHSATLLRLIGLGVAAFVLVIMLFNCVTRVGTGHVGVLTLFGKVTGETLGEGIHVINPLKTNNEMSIQTQTIKESASVPSSEGLMMSLDTSLIYHLNPDHAADVFQKIGADYENVVVEPTLRSAIRESTASHTANALYTGEREMVAKQIFEQVNEQLTKRGLRLHKRFTYPEVWRQGGESKAIALTSPLPFLTCFAFAYVATRLGLNSISGAAKLAIAIWVIGPLPLILTNAAFMKLHRVFVTSYAIGWLVKLVIAATAVGCVVH